METLTEFMEYLDERGAKYGIDGSEIYQRIPETVRVARLNTMTICNLKTSPISLHCLKAVTPLVTIGFLKTALSTAHVVQSKCLTLKIQKLNEMECSMLDTTRTALAGGALTVGGAVAEGAIVAAEGAFVAVETIAVIPTVLTVAAIGGAGVCFTVPSRSNLCPPNGSGLFLVLSAYVRNHQAGLVVSWVLSKHWCL